MQFKVWALKARFSGPDVEAKTCLFNSVIKIKISP